MEAAVAAKPEPSWFALYVQVNHEKEVWKRLEDRSIHSYLPIMETWSKRRDRRKRIQVPLFPGYVFFHTVMDGVSHHHVIKTPGAITIVRNSEGPLSIPDYQIENLQTILESRGALKIHPYLKEGDWVQVVKGPLTGCMGILLRHNPRKGRLVVSVDLIQRSVSIELDVEDVQPADSQQSLTSGGRSLIR